MNYFTIPEICIATEKDIPGLVQIMNSAYRGESSTRGWTTEAHLIAGEIRTNENDLRNVVRKPGSVILKYTNDKNQLVGCVNLQKHDERLYLGMFSVSPEEQGAGIGKNTASCRTACFERRMQIDLYAGHFLENRTHCMVHEAWVC